MQLTTHLIIQFNNVLVLNSILARTNACDRKLHGKYDYCYFFYDARKYKYVITIKYEIYFSFEYSEP